MSVRQNSLTSSVRGKRTGEHKKSRSRYLHEKMQEEESVPKTQVQGCAGDVFANKTERGGRLGKLSAVSLFSGAGGMDIGVAQSGFEILCQIEKDIHCCETLRLAAERNDDNTVVVEDDIRNIDVASLMLSLQLKSGDLDLLFGGPPCQPFSLIGQRKSMGDERGMLLFEIIRFAQTFRPKAVMIEQVKGILSAPDENGEKGGVFRRLLSMLEVMGYVPKWKVVRSADYGVPQLRERVIVVATVKHHEFRFPLPTHSDQVNVNGLLFSALPYRTVGQALEGLEKPFTKDNCLPSCNHVDVTPSRDKIRIAGVPEGSHLAKELHLPASQRCGLTKKDTTKFRRLSHSIPSITLRCGEIFFHPTEDRYLTPKEYMRLHGYPDDYILAGPIRGRSGTAKNLDQHRQVANSVPPPLARVMAAEIRRAIGCQKSLKYLDIPLQIPAGKRKKSAGKHTARS